VIYLRRRYEVLGDLGDAYEVLSNLFKKRGIPEDHRIPVNEDGTSTQLSSENLVAGLNEIVSYIAEIPSDYPSLLALFENEDQIKALYHASKNGYEKLQLTRILLDIETVDNSVVRKFINETYHIENEFIFQLDPSRFDLMPEYVVKECDNIVEAIE